MKKKMEKINDISIGNESVNMVKIEKDNDEVK
jgi:hypothetical protein